MILHTMCSSSCSCRLSALLQTCKDIKLAAMALTTACQSKFCHVHAGSRGHHRSHLKESLLMRLFDDSIMELLLIMAQHTHRVSIC